MPRIRVFLTLGASAAVALASPVASDAAAPSSTTAPAYPGNTIQIQKPKQLVAGTIVKVHLSGHAVWTDAALNTVPLPYTISLYVQNGDLEAHCQDSYSAQLQQVINLPSLNASGSGDGFVMTDSLSVQVPASGNSTDWSGDSVPFSVRPGIRHVVLCAYVRALTDDVASYQLPLTPAQPSCHFASASARRGARVGITCNVSGLLDARFTKAGARPKTLTESSKTGRGKLRLGSKLARGTYRVAFSSNGVKLGSSRLRVR